MVEHRVGEKILAYISLNWDRKRLWNHRVSRNEYARTTVTKCSWVLFVLKAPNLILPFILFLSIFYRFVALLKMV